MKKENLEMNKAWIVTADMGYGHQRAVSPLQELAYERVITVNSDPYNSKKENKLWDKTLKLYEFFSRMHSIPLVGPYIFKILDFFLKIPPEYEEADLSKITFQVKMLDKYIQKGLCEGFLMHVNKNKIPIITSFYAPAIAADLKGFREVYCIICDADLNRVWVARQPEKSHIKYFVPTVNAKTRLLQYGVKEKNIYHTGFPLPKELLGNQSLDVLKKNLGIRLQKLDPDFVFRNQKIHELEEKLGSENIQHISSSKITITYVVGGAGAQAEVGEQIAYSLQEKIRKGEVHLNLIAGMKRKVKYHYWRIINEDFQDARKHISVVSGTTHEEYFQKFNQALQNTDILWTKPSELSFFCALGIPIIMTPPIGSQEKFNRSWLIKNCAGIPQLHPKRTHVWLFDLLHKGVLAKMAWFGYTNTKQKGTFHIIDFFQKKEMHLS